MAGIGVIFNPHAKANRNGSADRVRRLQQVVGDEGLVRVTESIDQLRDAAAEFHKAGVDTVGVCGGEACIRNTRHTVSGLVEWRQLGLTDKQILERHPEFKQQLEDTLLLRHGPRYL